MKWRRGEPWLQEVRVAQNHAPSFPWDQADLTIQLPRSKWAQLGVTYPDGRALPADNLPASLLLPMGRIGPAFLANQNFAVYTEWNNSLIYSGLSCHPHRRQPADAWSLRAGCAIAVRRAPRVAVGVMGQLSRSAVKAIQIKYGLPADSWPTAELLARMRGGPRAQALPVGSEAVR